ncbi:hypothetical protein Glove_74g241 [Diversispora epigaea]|uniref:Uncharacterized protein n=1 Tax=Diversispora epigaea TaxID=1348612 RepID=A0A397JIB6_9GLOM|nr:hypothetical protein Glove_74g241 [Diversispora epigaea]
MSTKIPQVKDTIKQNNNKKKKRNDDAEKIVKDTIKQDDNNNDNKKKDDDKKKKGGKNKEERIIWVLSLYFSQYKYDEFTIENRSFMTKKLAEGAMRREARRLYKGSGIIQESSDKYFDEYDGEIHFGENPEEIGYRREFGYAQITPVKLENAESGDDVPSSTSEENSSDDDDYNYY